MNASTRRGGLGLCGLLSCLSLPLHAAEKPAERTFTLSQTVQSALQNNHRLLAAQEDIRVAGQRVAEAESSLYPQVGLNANASRYLGEQDFILPADFGSTILRPSRDLEPDVFYSARLSLRQPLYSGGRTRNTIRLARAAQEQARVGLEAIRGEVKYDAVKSFYDLLLHHRQADSADEAARAVDGLAARAARRDAAALVRLRAVQERLRRARAELERRGERAALAFRRALGLELYTQVAVQGELEVPRPLDLDLAKLLAWAQESRLDIRDTEYQREIDRLSVNLSEAERFPVVAFGAGYEFNDNSFPLERTQWNATLNVSLPLFDGFSSRARIRQRRYEANKSRVERAALEDRIQWEVRESHAEWRHWMEETKARGAAVERLRSVVQDLESGGDPAARAEAQEALLEARQSFWEAVHGHRVALAGLEKAVGRPLREE